LRPRASVPSRAPVIPRRRRETMILSHAHKFIYIKTMRTASSSIEVALAKICGPDDVITPTRRDMAELRGAQPAQNYRADHPLVPTRPLVRRLLRRPERYYHKSIGYYEHMPAWRVRAYAGEAVWNSYFKFTFDRNPWDRQVSFYFYKGVRKRKSASFDAFMANKRIAFIPNFSLYSENDVVSVDHVGKFENLEQEFSDIAARLGLAGQVELPHTNASERTTDYRPLYTPNTKALVEEWYRREIDLLGYEF
jgi:hypothetical protein